MGKTRKQRFRTNKPNQGAAQNLRDAIFNEEFNGDDQSEDAFIAIREQLQSASTDEKMIGLQSIAFLSLNPKKTEAMCESDIVRIASPLLVDPNANIRNAVAGALRNISLGGINICEVLVEQDVVTPLLSLMDEYISNVNWVPTIDRSVSHVEQLDLSADTFLQAVNLMWNLCESTSVALQRFNQANILESFMRFLNHTVFGIDIGNNNNLKCFEKILTNSHIFAFLAVAVAQCLLVISEDNAIAWRVLNQFAEDFVSIITNGENVEQTTMLRTVVAAILTNVPSLSTTYMGQIFNTLHQTLCINHRMALGKLTSLIPLHEKDDESKIDVEVSADDDRMEEETEQEAAKRRRVQDLPSEYETEAKYVGWILESQRIAAETITNICSSDENG